MPDLDAHLPAIAAGDPESFALWVAGAEARLRASLARFAAEVDAEAVVQETLLRVWQVAPRHRPDGRPESLLRLALRIARNLALDELRRPRLVASDEEELDALAAGARGGPEPAHGPDPFLRERIARCLGELRGPPAAALHARLRSGGAEPDRGLAEALGMRLNTFLQNVRRARLQVEACLERAGVRLAEAWR